MTAFYSAATLKYFVVGTMHGIPHDTGTRPTCRWYAERQAGRHNQMFLSLRVTQPKNNSFFTTHTERLFLITELPWWF